AGNLLCQERQPWRLDEVRAGQHTIARHADDVALETPEIRQEDLDRLPLALRPAFGGPLIPERDLLARMRQGAVIRAPRRRPTPHEIGAPVRRRRGDRKSTRLNSSHRCISYAVFCLKKKNLYTPPPQHNTTPLVLKNA